MSDLYPIESTIGICDGFNLCLPGNLIVDVVSAMTFSPHKGDALWIIGELGWRDLKLPVVSFEQLFIHRTPRIRGSHVAIFHGTIDTDKLPFYAVPVQAIPHNFNLLKESDLIERSDHLEIDFCSMKVTARGVSAIIPDLQAVEEKLLSSL